MTKVGDKTSTPADQSMPNDPLRPDTQGSQGVLVDVQIAPQGPAPQEGRAITAEHEPQSADSFKSAGDRLVDEIRSLLGPLVNSLARDSAGALRLDRVPSKDVYSFQDWIVSQAGVDDKKSFSDPYKKLLSEPKYFPLFQFLYQAVNPQFKCAVTPWQADALAKSLQGELIKIDGESFARRHFSTKDGRMRIAGVLRGKEYYDKAVRAELLKGFEKAAVGVLGEGVVETFLESELDIDLGVFSVQDWWNLYITDENMDRATTAALNMLKSAEQVYAQNEKKEKSYGTTETGLFAGVKQNQVKHFVSLSELKQTRADPQSQIQAQLADLWLLAAHDENWQGGHFERGKVTGARQFILNETERLIGFAKSVKTEQGMVALNNELQEFLKGSMYLDGGGLMAFAEHAMSNTGLESFFKEAPDLLRQQYDNLVQYSDEIKHAKDMGETILCPAKSKVPDQKMAGDVNNLIQALSKTKRSLWYAYKQHPALSRMLTQWAENESVGNDVRDIETANLKIDALIWKIAGAKSKEELEPCIKELYELLGPEGVLTRALQAAENDGVEMAMGMVQTILEIVVTSYALAGVGAIMRLAKGARAAVLAAKNLSRMAKASRVVGKKTKEAWEAFKIGANNQLVHNTLALKSGEVRQGSEKVLNWFKDAMATGFSMVFTALAPGSGSLGKTALKRFIDRYNPARLSGMLRMGTDSFMEIVEEMVDAYARQALDGNINAMTANEFDEIWKLCLLGSLKVGEVKAIIEGKASRGTVSSDTTDQTTTDQATTDQTTTDTPSTPPLSTTGAGFVAGGLTLLGATVAQAAPGVGLLGQALTIAAEYQTPLVVAGLVAGGLALAAFAGKTLSKKQSPEDFEAVSRNFIDRKHPVDVKKVDNKHREAVGVFANAVVDLLSKTHESYSKGPLVRYELERSLFSQLQKNEITLNDIEQALKAIREQKNSDEDIIKVNELLFLMKSEFVFDGRQMLMKDSAPLSYVQREFEIAGVAEETDRVAREILNRYPPEDCVYVSLGRSPAAIAATIAQNERATVVTLPMTSVWEQIPADAKGSVDPLLYKNLDSSAQENTRRYLAEHLPPSGELKGRKVVVIDYTTSGAGLAIGADYISSYYPGVAVEAVALYADVPASRRREPIQDIGIPTTQLKVNEPLGSQLNRGVYKSVADSGEANIYLIHYGTYYSKETPQEVVAGRPNPRADEFKRYLAEQALQRSAVKPEPAVGGALTQDVSVLGGDGQEGSVSQVDAGDVTSATEVQKTDSADAGFDVAQLPVLQTDLDDRHVVIGSGPDVDIAFGGDEGVLSRHCTLIKEHGKWGIYPEEGAVVEKFNPQSGQFVQIERPVLVTSGTVLRIGKRVFRFEPAPFPYQLTATKAEIRAAWDVIDQQLRQSRTPEERLAILENVTMGSFDLDEAGRPVLHDSEWAAYFWGNEETAIAIMVANDRAMLGKDDDLPPEHDALCTLAYARWNKLYWEAKREVYLKQTGDQPLHELVGVKDPHREVVTFYHVGNQMVAEHSASLEEALSYGGVLRHPGIEDVWAIDVPMKDLGKVMGRDGEFFSPSITPNYDLPLEGYGLRHIGTFRDNKLHFDEAHGDIVLYGNLRQLLNGYSDVANYTREHGEMPLENQRTVTLKPGTVWDVSGVIDWDAGFTEQFPHGSFSAFADSIARSNAGTEQAREHQAEPADVPKPEIVGSATPQQLGTQASVKYGLGFDPEKNGEVVVKDGEFARITNLKYQAQAWNIDEFNAALDKVLSAQVSSDSDVRIIDLEIHLPAGSEINHDQLSSMVAEAVARRTIKDSPDVRVTLHMPVDARANIYVGKDGVPYFEQRQDRWCSLYSLINAIQQNPAHRMTVAEMIDFYQTMAARLNKDWRVNAAEQYAELGIHAGTIGKDYFKSIGNDPDKIFLFSTVGHVYYVDHVDSNGFTYSDPYHPGQGTRRMSWSFNDGYFWQFEDAGQIKRRVQEIKGEDDARQQDPAAININYDGIDGLTRRTLENLEVNHDYTTKEFILAIPDLVQADSVHPEFADGREFCIDRDVKFRIVETGLAPQGNGFVYKKEENVILIDRNTFENTNIYTLMLEIVRVMVAVSKLSGSHTDLRQQAGHVATSDGSNSQGEGGTQALLASGMTFAGGVPDLKGFDQTKTSVRPIPSWQTLNDEGPNGGDGKQFASLAAKNLFVARYGWAAPTPDAIEAINDFTQGGLVLGVGSGRGLWEAELQATGVDVLATDNFSSEGSEKIPELQQREGGPQTYIDVQPLSHREAIEQHGAEADTLMMVWPPSDKPMAAEALRDFENKGGDKLVFVGQQGYGDIDSNLNGDTEFWKIIEKDWVEVDLVEIPNWGSNLDAVHLYRRKPKPVAR
ncbi:MAG: FHA domain-containing protein [Deltaproteobacteria bacterium]|nr:FHA domain-containing protein [Deltaproteobacteria bacterium]